MNVLSLFDGKSCGRIALDRVGIHVDNYYASEIDPYAVKVSNTNYPDIVQLGDVTQVSSAQLPKIDLLLGGSPCQDFSRAGKGAAFEGDRGKLFWEFVRLLKETQPTHFLLENVKMKQEYQDVISEALGVQPVLINSNIFVPQNRERLYWTNIPIAPLPDKTDTTLPDILNKDREWFDIQPWALSKWGDKRKVDALRTVEHPEAFTITTNNTHPKNHYLNADRTQMTRLTPDELEMLQGVPEGYTAHVSNTRRHHMLGNGWTVPVISHIFNGILEDNVAERYYVSEDQLGKWDGSDMLNPSYRSQANKVHSLEKPLATLCAGTHGYAYGYIPTCDGRLRRLTPLEFERLQTVPDNYTTGVSDTQRYKMLGNGWTIDTIAHIFKGLHNDVC